MTIFKTTILGTAAAALLLGSSAMAAPVASMAVDRSGHMASEASNATNIINIHSRAERRAKRSGRRVNRNKRRANRSERRANRSQNRRWRGHRGSRRYRRGYRRHSDGWWYPLAAFGAGIVGSAIANSNHNTSRHVAWCDNRYRSYRVRDDTFQPYNGPRKRCNSPYD